MKIGARIKQLRKKFGLKQLDLANSLRVSPQAVSKWEKDENFPDIFLIKKIAQLFDVSLDDLLGMNEEKRDVFEATVFASSLNRFAQKGVQLSAKELAQWTNVIFQHMTEVVLNYGGVPVKYTGDGFLCFFSGVDHADRALKAARDIDRINLDKEIVVFLNSGEIYFGVVGHADYASRDIYGDAVNKSFLLMNTFSQKVKRGVGISEEVKSSLKGKHTFKKIPDISIPQLSKKINIYKFNK